MKRIILLLMLFSGFNLSAQTLIDLYKKGTVKLVPESGYAPGNDWQTIFASYNDYNENARGQRSYVRGRMSIVMMPDGSLVVNHPKRDYFSLFDANGRFIKNFSIKNRPKNVIKGPRSIQGVINNHFYTNADNMGNILCLDFDGNYVKTLKLNYMIRNMITLSDTKLAVSGFSIWKGKTRRFVSIVDYDTNKEKIIWDNFPDSGATVQTVQYTSADKEQFNKAFPYEWAKVPDYDSRFHNNVFATTPIIQFANNLLTVAIPSTGEIKVFDIHGKLQTSAETEWKPNVISVEEQRTLLTNSIETYKKTELTDKTTREEAETARKQILEILNRQFDRLKPIRLPLFSNVLKDSDGNLLFFEFPKEEGGNKFNVWVFRDGGKFECQSSFECDDYDLIISPSRILFHNGYIYALQNQKNAQGIPLRVVKFKVNN